MAGRADEGASPAADTAGGYGIPGGVLEVLVQPGLDLLQIEFFRLRFGQRKRLGTSGLGKQSLVAVDQRFTLFRVALAGITASFQWGQEQVASPGLGRGETNCGTEACVVGLACTTADDACFCTAVGLSPAETRGSDLFLTPLEGGGYGCQTYSEKGEALINRHPELFSEPSGSKALPLAEPQTEKFDLKKVKAWLDEHFEDPSWDSVATRCVGCGACAFVCPACHCFDIVDEGTEKSGKRRKNWDACGFSKFTNHASGHNPRDLQPKRYRNRIMHKFKYYDDKFGQTLCSGCGRCIRICPMGIDIAHIVEEISKKQE